MDNVSINIQMLMNLIGFSWQILGQGTSFFFNICLTSNIWLQISNNLNETFHIEGIQSWLLAYRMHFVMFAVSLLSGFNIVATVCICTGAILKIHQKVIDGSVLTIIVFIVCFMDLVEPFPVFWRRIVQHVIFNCP